MVHPCRVRAGLGTSINLGEKWLQGRPLAMSAMVNKARKLLPSPVNARFLVSCKPKLPMVEDSRETLLNIPTPLCSPKPTHFLRFLCSTSCPSGWAVSQRATLSAWLSFSAISISHWTRINDFARKIACCLRCLHSIYFSSLLQCLPVCLHH